MLPPACFWGGFPGEWLEAFPDLKRKQAPIGHTPRDTPGVYGTH